MSERRDRIRVHIEGKEYSVVGGEFKEMLAAVKQIVGRRFIGELKVWQLPGSAEDIQHQLAIVGYELEGGTPITPVEQVAPGRPGGDRIRLKVGNYQLAVVGGSFQEMLDVVKKLPGRRFDGNNKVWEIPGDAALVKGVIEAAGFQLEGAERIPGSEVPPMEPLPGPAESEPPPYEPPDFAGADDIPPYEPPDWWDDDNMPPPPDDWEADMASPAFDEPLPFDREPSPFDPPPADAAPASAPIPPDSASGDRIRIRLGQAPFVVSGGSFQQMLAVVKNLPGRRFNSQDKVWEIPENVTLDSLDRAITEAGFMLMPG